VHPLCIRVPPVYTLWEPPQPGGFAECLLTVGNDFDLSHCRIVSYVQSHRTCIYGIRRGYGEAPIRLARARRGVPPTLSIYIASCAAWEPMPAAEYPAHRANLVR
jgi:hypothetical protein